MKSRKSWVIVLAVAGMVLGVAVAPVVAAGSQGVIAGTEVTVLKAHYAALEGTLGGGNQAINLTPDYDMEASPRFWLGYQTCSGLALKMRYWKFDQSASHNQWFNDEYYKIGLGLEAETLDLEFSQSGCFCNWELEVAGGLRYAQVEDGLSVEEIGYDTGAALSRHVHGIGPTVAISARRPVGCRGLALVGGLRVSLLFGDSKASFDDDDLVGNPFGGDVNFLDGLSLKVDDQTMRIYEVEIGAEWSRCTRSGARLYARAVLEAQTWEAPFLVDTSFGFVGPSFSIAIER